MGVEASVTDGKSVSTSSVSTTGTAEITDAGSGGRRLDSTGKAVPCDFRDKGAGSLQFRSSGILLSSVSGKSTPSAAENTLNSARRYGEDSDLTGGLEVPQIK